MSSTCNAAINPRDYTVTMVNPAICRPAHLISLQYYGNGWVSCANIVVLWSVSWLMSCHVVIHFGGISLLLSGLPSLPSQCYSNGLGNIDNLCSNLVSGIMMLL